MIKYSLIALLFFICGVLASQVLHTSSTEPYILENEKDIPVKQAAPHSGGGETTGFNFFSKAKDFHLAFRKRVLHPGSAIGYHLQKEDEIYYVLSGRGEMQMNGKSFEVKSGDAILTRPGSSHGLKQTGTEDLVIIINYILKKD
ncbi:MAG: cupin domain-containing protein [Chitinophagaceae bacterium]|nr:cupin domain-containing protein [Chitinophagaceae bacterium]